MAGIQDTRDAAGRDEDDMDRARDRARPDRQGARDGFRAAQGPDRSGPAPLREEEMIRDHLGYAGLDAGLGLGVTGMTGPFGYGPGYAPRAYPGPRQGARDRAGDGIGTGFGARGAAPGRASGRSSGGGHRGRGPRNYARSDDRILDDVSDRLTRAGLDASEIEVGVRGGEVTLDGTVDDRAAKRQAEDLAWAVRGVTQVQNNLRPRSPGMARPVGPAGLAGGTGAG